MSRRCPKCGAEAEHAWLYNVLEVGEDIMVSVKLRPEQAHELYNVVNKEFQGNVNAAMREAIELLTKHYGGITSTSKYSETTKPPVRDAELGWECSKCGYVWNMGKG